MAPQPLALRRIDIPFTQRPIKHTPIVDRPDGTSLIPGLSDLHTHTTLGVIFESAQLIDVKECKTVDALIEKLKEYRDRTIIVACNVDTNAIPILTREALDQVSSDVPVLLFDPSYHGGWLNTKAMQSIAEAAKSSEGKFVGHLDEHGHWTEQYLYFCLSLVGQTLGEERLTQGILHWLADQLRHGTVRIHEMDIGDMFSLRCLVNAREEWDRRLPDLPFPVKELYAPPAVVMALETEPYLKIKVRRYFNMGPIRLKLYADGAIGSRTACLTRPYVGEDRAGILVNTPENLRDLLATLPEIGGIAIHAIGDKGIKKALEMAELAYWLRRLPTRIEHFEISGDHSILDASRDSVQGVSIQPPFIKDIGNYHSRLGDRVNQINPVAKILDLGIPVNFGTDDIAADYPAPRMIQALSQAVCHPVEEHRIPLEVAVSIAATHEFYRDDDGLDVGSLVVVDSAVLAAMRERVLTLAEAKAGIRQVIYHGYDVKDLVRILRG